MSYLEYYLLIACFSGIITAFVLLEEDIEGINTFWDWVIFNLFWIVGPVKALIKFVKNVLK